MKSITDQTIPDCHVSGEIEHQRSGASSGGERLNETLSGHLSSHLNTNHLEYLARDLNSLFTLSLRLKLFVPAAQIEVTVIWIDLQLRCRHCYLNHTHGPQIHLSSIDFRLSPLSSFKSEIVRHDDQGRESLVRGVSPLATERLR